MLRELSDRASLAREVRAVSTEFEVRAEDDGKVTFDGVASVVDTPYQVRDMFGEFEETIAKGAFRKTLAEKSDVRLLVNHEGVPLARTKSKTLKLSASPDLRAVADLDASNPDVQRIQSAMSRGDLDQMSIGMRVHRQEWNEDYTQRTIREAELFDVSVVTYPASPTTTASLRSVDDLLAELADVDIDEGELRRAIDALTKRLPVLEPVVAAPSGPRPELVALWAKRL
jgi:HK97 family phage prohead protease